MIPWEMTRRDPMIDVRMRGNTPVRLRFLVMLATGAILLRHHAIPAGQLVQQYFGYTATWAGLVLRRAAS